MGRQTATEADVLTTLDAAAARRWAVVTRSALATHRAEIDGLNVYPVPDGDTGTNLFLTVDGALAAVAVSDDGPVGTLAQQSRAFARAMLLTARGNSGVILSQIFRGLADEVEADDVEALDGAGLARALVRADALAWAGVGRPVEGTILSVSRAASRAGAAAGDDLQIVTTTVLAAAREALARTPEQLPALARAGVVDAGGAGYVVLLESLERVVRSDVVPEPSHRRGGAKRRTGRSAAAAGGSGEATSRRTVEASSGRGRGRPSTTSAGYEVTYRLDGTDGAGVERLRARLDALGDSVVVVGDAGLWTVHVHVGPARGVGEAIEAGIEAGRPHRVEVTRFADHDHADEAHPRDRAGAPRHDDPRAGDGTAGRDPGAPDGPPATAAPASSPVPPAPPVEVAVVACAAGEGLATLFTSAGARVVPSAPRRRASAGQLLEAVRATGSREVLLLPNDGDTVLAAEAAAGVAAEEGVTVVVVPQARAAVQGIAALAVWSPGAALRENATVMGDAAAATRRGSVTFANRDAQTAVGPCRVGDVLGLVDGEVVLVGHDLPTVAVRLLTLMLADEGELVTLVVGEEAPAGLSEAVEAAAGRARPGVEVTRVYGGQPVYPLFVGVE